jgi:hypothetical protein
MFSPPRLGRLVLVALSWSNWSRPSASLDTRRLRFVSRAPILSVLVARSGSPRVTILCHGLAMDRFGNLQQWFEQIRCRADRLEGNQVSFRFCIWRKFGELEGIGGGRRNREEKRKEHKGGICTWAKRRANVW